MSVKFGLEAYEIINEFEKQLGMTDSKTYKKLIEAVTTVILKNNEQIRNDLRFNKTEFGEILEINDDGSYRVRINDTDVRSINGIEKGYDLFTLDKDFQYKKGDKVLIETINNEFSQQYIKGKIFKKIIF